MNQIYSGTNPTSRAKARYLACRKAWSERDWNKVKKLGYEAGVELDLTSWSEALKIFEEKEFPRVADISISNYLSRIGRYPIYAVQDIKENSVYNKYLAIFNGKKNIVHCKYFVREGEQYTIGYARRLFENT